jgi:hypothetical protein
MSVEGNEHGLYDNRHMINVDVVDDDEAVQDGDCEHEKVTYFVLTMHNH